MLDSPTSTSRSRGRLHSTTNLPPPQDFCNGAGNKNIVTPPPTTTLNLSCGLDIVNGVSILVVRLDVFLVFANKNQLTML